MPEFVALSGVIIAALALALILKPRPMEGLVVRVLTSSWLYLAALLALLAGAGLIHAAGGASAALVEGAGWCLVLVALALVVLSRPAGRRFAGWLQARPAGVARLLLAPLALLGAVLVWTALA